MVLVKISMKSEGAISYYKQIILARKLGRRKAAILREGKYNIGKSMYL